MRLVTVGTGTVSPHPRRTSACHWVEIGGDHAVRLLLDCGPGACHRLAGFGLPWFDVTHVALTHFHADHYADLPSLLFAMRHGATAPRTAPLTLIGPAGLGAKLDALAAAFGAWVREPGFPMDVVEIEAERAAAGTGAAGGAGGADGGSAAGRPTVSQVRLGPGVTLTACRTPHTPESLAFSVATPAARLVYTGDTGPSEALGDWARPCDLLLAECSLPEALALDFHLTPRRAGALAARANAKRLVLTHLYPPVEGTDILAEVRREYRGEAAVAGDGEEYWVGG